MSFPPFQNLDFFSVCMNDEKNSNHEYFIYAFVFPSSVWKITYFFLHFISEEFFLFPQKLKITASFYIL